MYSDFTGVGGHRVNTNLKTLMKILNQWQNGHPSFATVEKVVQWHQQCKEELEQLKQTQGKALFGEYVKIDEVLGKTQ